MSFENRVRQLAQGASLNIAKVDNRLALLKFKMASGVVQPLWIIPYDDVWEFSTQSGFQLERAEDFPQALLTVLLTKNGKNKRAFWCIETIADQYTLSAMLNFPETALTSAEFGRICWALASEVEMVEQAIRQIVQT
jgi:hypothetical protein